MIQLKNQYRGDYNPKTNDILIGYTKKYLYKSIKKLLE